jgi:hypothetical protein
MLKWILRKYRGLLVLVKIRTTWAGDRKKIFTHHYAQNYWGSEESRSGCGSTLEYTANIRAELPGLFERLQIKTVLDAPCGDYNWFRLVPRSDGVHYLGGDIVDPLIAANQANFGSANTRFAVIDIIQGDLPKADLWLCRDCLFHFSNEDILTTIRNFLRSDIRYLLTSTHSGCTANTDIATGSFRLLNLELPPFNFGRAILYIDDYVEGFPVRKLALWDRRELAKAFVRP